MLIQKKISVKKLAISISIIFLMVGGTGLMLYQNKKLTTLKPVKVNIQKASNNSVPVAPAAVTKNDDLGTGEAGQAENINNINDNGSLELDIFFSDKFKNLRENIFLATEQPEVGKRDPFKPN